MTKDEYMQALKNNIQSLTIDEQAEALQYYSDYFDDAGDDEKVMKELGTPEEVAAIIIERFANALVGTEKNESSDSDGNKKDDDSEYTNFSDALFYSFDNKLVKNIDFSFGAAEVVVIPGTQYSIETRGVLQDSMVCRVDSEGTLIVKNLKKLQRLNFFSHDHVSRFVPRILITVPKSADLNNLKIIIGAGSFMAKDILLNCKKGELDVGAGNLSIKNLHGNNMNIRCGMGSLKLEGALAGRTNVDCGMGSVKFELQGNSNEYSYDSRVGLGDFKFNDEKKSGVCQNYAENRKENHFSVNCGMGSVNISLRRY